MTCRWWAQQCQKLSVSNSSIKTQASPGTQTTFNVLNRVVLHLLICKGSSVEIVWGHHNIYVVIDNFPTHLLRGMYVQVAVTGSHCLPLHLWKSEVVCDLVDVKIWWNITRRISCCVNGTHSVETAVFRLSSHGLGFCLGLPVWIWHFHTVVVLQTLFSSLSVTLAIYTCRVR